MMPVIFRNTNVKSELVMDYKNRPKIKDLKEYYGCDAFYLHTDAVLGCCVCFDKDKRSERIVNSLRRRGYIVIPERLSGLWEVYYIKTKDER